MIRRLRVSSIWSENLDNLLPFYRDVLGLKVALSTPGFVVLGEPDVPAVALGTHREVRGRASDPARHIVGFESDDIVTDFGRLREVGVDFIEEPTPYGDVWAATFPGSRGQPVAAPAVRPDMSATRYRQF